nr:3769_t:CDS:2 [Entrophospora candida]
MQISEWLLLLSPISTLVYNDDVFDTVESKPSVLDNTQCSTQEVDLRHLPQEEFNEQLSLLNRYQQYIDNSDNNTNNIISTNEPTTMATFTLHPNVIRAMTDQRPDSVYYGLSETNNTNIDISHFYYGENLIGYNNRYSDSLFDS